MYITNIRRGKGNRNQFVYAELREDNGDIVINATLDYITQRLISDSDLLPMWPKQNSSIPISSEYNRIDRIEDHQF